MNDSDFIMKLRSYQHLQHEILSAIQSRCTIPNAKFSMHRSGVTIDDDEIYTVYIDGRALASLKVNTKNSVIHNAYFVMNDNMIVKGYKIMSQKSLYELKEYLRSFENTVFSIS